MSIKSQGHSLILVKGQSDFKVKCLTFGLYTQVSNSGPQGPLVLRYFLLHMTCRLVLLGVTGLTDDTRKFSALADLYNNYY